MKSQLTSKTSTTTDDLPEIPRETDLAPLLTAWDLAHPSITDPDWRHLLDEIAHPRTTQAFHGLAGVAV
ncbi:hypothetical protein [Streptomyces sp. NBC_00038]|uniref:hypothetical protein n=1 Tax=Streptomyces sp. NBC_00038 TaxID=2903615 RepID=UPI00225A3946|nr:hypothetical protein [Streptomyces sp. NBC_00038]MCX5558706.1 hypothetical protein [Streptomyces sp. NBC_00038]